jgi:hypothetical protein
MKIIGQIVHIRFYDHSQSAKHCAEPVICNVFGIVTKEDESHYQITSWAVEQDQEGADMNDECFSIVKGTIIAMNTLKKKANVRLGKRAVLKSKGT